MCNSFSQLPKYNMSKIVSAWLQIDISPCSFNSCFSTLIMTIFQSAWPQLDIIPCSYQSNSLIALILLCLAAPFVHYQAVFVQHYTIQGFTLDYLLSNITVRYQLTLLVLLISAPCSISALTTSILPNDAALCNGVYPFYIQNRTKLIML